MRGRDHKFARAVETWPPIVAMPLRDLHSTEPARLRLWAAFDLLEMLARLMVVLGIAEITMAHRGRMPPDLIRELYDKIEEPTLGAWQSMAEAIARRVNELEAPLFKELPETVERLGRLLRGGVERANQHEENALIAVRNAYAHGKNITERRAAALLEVWQPKVDQLINNAGWLSDVELLARRADGAVERLAGSDCTASPVVPQPVDMPARAGTTAMRRAERLVVLDPLIVFDAPQLDPEGSGPESDPALQVYARRGPMRLLFTPFGTDSVIQSLGAEALTEIFDKLFDLDAIRREAQERDWVRDFAEDIQREARRMVGRAEESDQLWDAAATTHEGALWVDGPAGIGKSALMAWLAQQLVVEAQEREYRADQQKWLILPYRFRAGNDRCRRNSFLKFILERLEAWRGLAAESAESAKQRRGKVELQQIRQLLARVKPNRVILLTDGLDEIDRFDPSIVDEVLPQLQSESVLVVCFGRPEPRLLALRDRLRAIEPLPGGVPKMTLTDIRGLLFARIDRASARLIRQDRDAADGTIVNRFVEQVAANADGLPIYVELVISDILAQRLRMLDAVDARQLPKSLAAYFKSLIERHGLDDLTAIRGLIAATLTLAHEPLGIEAIAALVRRQGFSLDPAGGATKVEAALTTLGDMIVPAETPEKTRGYRLYHDSLRRHLEQSTRFTDTLQTMRRVLINGAAAPASDAAAAYLYRNGLRHLLAASDVEQARALLATFDYLMDRLMTLAAAKSAPVDAISQDWAAIVKAAGRGGGNARHAEAFWRERAHMFRRGNSDWPSYKILLQAAIEHGDDSDMSRQADAWLGGGHCNWAWLRRLGRPHRAEESPCLCVLEGHSDEVVGALQMQDGRVLSWSKDRTLRLWDGSSGTPGPVLSGHTDWICGALVMPGGRILSWSFDKTLRIWDDHTGSPGPVLEGHTDAVTDALAMPDGRILSWSTDSAKSDIPATSSRSSTDRDILEESRDYGRGYSADHTLRLWDAITGLPGPTLRGHTEPIRGALVTPGGRIYSWSKDKTFREWNSQDGGSRVVLSDINILASGGGCICFKRTNSSLPPFLPLLFTYDVVNEIERDLGIAPFHVHGAICLPDGGIAAWSNDRDLDPSRPSGTARSWNGTRGVPGAVMDLGERGPFIRGALAIPDGRILFLLGDSYGDRSLLLWNPTTGQVSPTFEAYPAARISLRKADIVGASALFSNAIVSWATDDTLTIWDATSGKPRSVFGGHNGRINGVLILSDHRMLSWSWDQTLRLWNPELGITCSPRRSTGPVAGVLEVPVGRILSWSTYDCALQLWDERSGALLSTFEGHTDQVKGALILPDGHFLSWSRDKTLRIWDRASFNPIGVLEGHEAGVLGAISLADHRIYRGQ